MTENPKGSGRWRDGPTPRDRPVVFASFVPRLCRACAAFANPFGRHPFYLSRRIRFHARALAGTARTELAGPRRGAAQRHDRGGASPPPVPPAERAGTQYVVNPHFHARSGPPIVPIDGSQSGYVSDPGDPGPSERLTIKRTGDYRCLAAKQSISRRSSTNAPFRPINGSWWRCAFWR
ncbi:hypothetical protein PUN4_420042 [Paraburkholderia unamae]|nr:hypothetical protein PUN4_420042 [Paraburkholderia unamae]